MSYGLLWIEMLASCLFWVAAAAAWIAPIKRKWVRAVLMTVAVLIPLLPLGGFVVLAGALKFKINVEQNWFAYAVSLLASYFVGITGILIRAGRHEPGAGPAAVSWRRGPLTAAWMAAVAVGAMTVWNIDLSIRARANILALQASTRFLTELPVPMSDAQNAAPLYEKAFARLSDDPPTDVMNPPLGEWEKFNPDEPATISFLARQAKTISLLRQAAALPACRFDGDFEFPGSSVLDLEPTLNEERNAANVLRLHSEYELAQGKVADAIADAIAILEMSRQFGRRPALVSSLVAIGVNAEGVFTLQDALPAVRRPEELTGLNAEEFPSAGRTFWYGLVGEECFGLSEFSEIGFSTRGLDRNQTNPGNPPKPPYQIVPFRLLMLSDELDGYLQMMQELQRAARVPYYKARAEVAALDEESDSSHSHKGMFTSILAPAMARALKTAASIDAEDAAAQVAVAMTRYRLDHGTLPARLDDLIPTYLDAIPLDPFDGKSMRLRIQDNQWIIYSVGWDGKYDGSPTKLNSLSVTLKLASPAASRP
jgi:hypothetical protein